MKRIVIPMVAALAGSAVTYFFVRGDADLIDRTGAQAESADTNFADLEKDVARFREQLAAEKKKSAPALAAEKRSTAIAPDPAQEAKAHEEMLKQRKEEVLKRLGKKIAGLTNKLNLTPEQAAATKEWHRPWMEAQLAAQFKYPADPRSYHLRVIYRPDLPPAVQGSLSTGQQAVWQKYDEDAKADAVENMTNGEMGFIAQRLGLSRDQKDQIFEHLSQLYLEDTKNDLTNVVDLATLSAQKDLDNERRRKFYSAILTPEQMQKWEELATKNNADILKQYVDP